MSEKRHLRGKKSKEDPIYSIDRNFGHLVNKLPYPALFHYIRVMVFCDDPKMSCRKKIFSSSVHSEKGFFRITAGLNVKCISSLLKIP
jgi:hypothetical protein